MMGAKTKYILAIDQSTTGTKAVLFDNTGLLINCTKIAHKQYYPNPGWVEHVPKEIIQRSFEAVTSLLKSTGIQPEQIAALGLSNQRETVLVWDKLTGEPVYNAVVWQCQRASAICKVIADQGGGDLVFSKTGLVLSPYFPAAKIKWILDNVSGVRNRAEAGELVFGTIDSWLVWNLTGGKIHAIDYSNASRTQLFNIHEKCWDDELMKIFTIPKTMAPEVRNSNDIYGNTLNNSVFGKGIPITGVLGDSHAALFGQNCFKAGMVKCTYGTGSSVMMNIGKKLLEPKSKLSTSIAWSINGEIEYVLEGNINCAGDTVRWLVDELELIPDASSAEKIAKSLQGSEGVYFIPAFVGLGAPYWDSDAKASITGITRGTKKAHIVRAAEESIAYQIKDVLDLMVKESGTELKELRVDGGPTRDSFLMQFQADILNMPVVCASIEEMSAIGAAYMAGLAVGFWNSKEELQSLRKIGLIYYPEMDIERRDILYSGWKEAILRALTKN